MTLLEHREWPYERERINVVEFYHRILWATQQEEPDKGDRRVSFSVEPPIVYEYEAEYSKSLLLNCQFLFQKAKSYQKERYYHLSSSVIEEEDEEEDAEEVQTSRLHKTTSFVDLIAVSQQSLDDFPKKNHDSSKTQVDHNHKVSDKRVNKKFKKFIESTLCQRIVHTFKSSSNLLHKKASLLSLHKPKAAL